MFNVINHRKKGEQRYNSKVTYKIKYVKTLI